jgi:glycosyltransferase involved in cell wall biosynthesis
MAFFPYPNLTTRISMKILFSSASFAGHYGGPAYSVSRLAAELGELGANTAIWAPDGSAEEAAIPTNAPVHRLSGSLETAVRKFGQPDVYHDSGIWLSHNHAIAKRARRERRPLVVSVRGMLEPWALAHKKWKKQLAWILYQRRDLRSAHALHVTSETEAAHLGALDIGPRIVQAPNGIDLPHSRPAQDVADQPRRVAFLGRLHPVKGLPILIEAWSRAQVPGWQLEIGGPDENGHRGELEKLAVRLGVRGSVLFTGHVTELEKSAFFSRAAVFALPSYSENFGISAAEALAHGVPVIASKGTPWAGLVSERCGWHVETSVSGFEQALRAAITTDHRTRTTMGQRGRAYVERAFSWHAAALQIWQLHQEVIV